jgi:hypothetical protein
MQKCRVLLAQVAKSPREGEASLLGRQACRSCQHVWVWSSWSYSLRQGMAYGCSTVLATVVQWEWWLFTNSPSQHGLVCWRRGLRPVIPLLRGEVVMSLYGESGCPITGWLLSGPRPCFPGPSWPGRGHKTRSEWERWLPVVIPMP